MYREGNKFLFGRRGFSVLVGFSFFLLVELRFSRVLEIAATLQVILGPNELEY